MHHFILFIFVFGVIYIHTPIKTYSHLFLQTVDGSNIVAAYQSYWCCSDGKIESQNVKAENKWYFQYKFCYLIFEIQLLIYPVKAQ